MEAAHPMYIEVALLSAPYSDLTYVLPDAFPGEFWQPGLRVLVPVGKTIRAACITGKPRPDAQAGISYRAIIWPLEGKPLINTGLLALVHDMALRQGVAPGFILGHILPKGLREASFRLSWQNGQERHEFDPRAIQALSADAYAELAEAFMAGNARFAEGGKQAVICSLAIDPPWPLRPAATRQIEILDYLYDQGATPKDILLKRLGRSAGQPLARLVQQGHVTLTCEQQEPMQQDMALVAPPDQQVALNAEQQAALAGLTAGLESAQPETRLLYGITGSGKTAVYVELAKRALQKGRSVLLLAPEVALAHKLYKDVEAGLPGAPRYLYHGYQTPLRRERIFREVACAGRPAIIVGTRSALFLPLRNPGCIILDEEHDSSYKQDEGFTYHAKELAWFRIRQNGGLLVLGSATPDIRTFNAGQTGKLPVLALRKRVAGAKLPPIELARLDNSAGVGQAPNDSGLLAPESESALRDCLARGEQAVILLNRRGYAPIIYCLGCEKTLRCPNCQIGMSYHKSIGRLVCHYCGYGIAWPATCPECGSSNYITMGEGTEKLAERLEDLAGMPVLRLDRDSARRPESLDRILKEFGAGKSPFLVGTQMLSKGHHFPNVTCVIVADGDIGLNLPDYRAAERSFQLLIQAAGRAGRGSRPGMALIQTRNPSHYCWQHICNYDYEGFYAAELALREKYKYPPYIRLGLMRISFPANESRGVSACQELGNDLRRAARAMGVIMLGPAPAPLAMLKGRKRFQCLVKAREWQPMRELWYIAQKREYSRYLRISLDLDPVNML